MQAQGKVEERMHVANSCNGYNTTASGLMSSMGSSSSKSCSNCTHFKNNKCDVNLYDKVVASLDQC